MRAERTYAQRVTPRPHPCGVGRLADRRVRLPAAAGQPVATMRPRRPPPGEQPGREDGEAVRRQVDRRRAPQMDGATVDVTFPPSALDGLGDTWNWRAVTTAAGTDVAACPEPGEDPAPQERTFPG